MEGKRAPQYPTHPHATSLDEETRLDVLQGFVRKCGRFWKWPTGLTNTVTQTAGTGLLAVQEAIEAIDRRLQDEQAYQGACPYR